MLGGYLAVLGAVLCLSCGLYYAAELAGGVLRFDGKAAPVRDAGRRGGHLLLWLDGFPLRTVRHWNFMSWRLRVRLLNDYPAGPSSPAFILAILAFLLSHYSWFTFLASGEGPFLPFVNSLRLLRGLRLARALLAVRFPLNQRQRAAAGRAAGAAVVVGVPGALRCGKGRLREDRRTRGSSATFRQSHGKPARRSRKPYAEAPRGSVGRRARPLAGRPPGLPRPAAGSFYSSPHGRRFRLGVPPSFFWILLASRMSRAMSSSLLLNTSSASSKSAGAARRRLGRLVRGGRVLLNLIPAQPLQGPGGLFSYVGVGVEPRELREALARLVVDDVDEAPEVPRRVGAHGSLWVSQ